MGIEMSEATKRDVDDNLKSLVKIGRILDCFTTSDRALSLAEICQRTAYPKSTTHRLLASMREIGLLDQDRERDRYRLGLKLLELGNVVLANLELNREARPLADALRNISGHAVHLAVFDGRQAVVIHRAEPAQDAGAPLTLIENAPVYCTSVGKAILAFQDEETLAKIIAGGLRRFTETTICEEAALRQEVAKIRSRGYAVDEGEHQPGLRCIGAPIRDQSGRVFAGISVSGPSWRIASPEVERLAEVVIYHADLISQRLGYRDSVCVSRIMG